MKARILEGSALAAAVRIQEGSVSGYTVRIQEGFEQHHILKVTLLSLSSISCESPNSGGVSVSGGRVRMLEGSVRSPYLSR